jgi:hypothetical protein
MQFHLSIEPILTRVDLGTYAMSPSSKNGSVWSATTLAIEA